MIPASIVITGPTASGKSDLALELAQKIEGEIVCTDSMQVYRGLDIGTAKPTKAEQSAVPHHQIDLCNPDEHYSAGQYARDAENTLNKLGELGKIPILVGWSFRKKNGFPLQYSMKLRNLGYPEMILHLLFKKHNDIYRPDKKLIDVFNKLLILHADHEQNCSTSTVRIVGSSHAGLFPSISAGISALWGPLHGGANQAVLEMLKSIKEDGGNTKKYII